MDEVLAQVAGINEMFEALAEERSREIAEQSSAIARLTQKLAAVENRLQGLQLGIEFLVSRVEAASNTGAAGSEDHSNI